MFSSLTAGYEGQFPQCGHRYKPSQGQCPCGRWCRDWGNCSCSLLLPFGFAHVQSQVWRFHCVMVGYFWTCTNSWIVESDGTHLLICHSGCMTSECSMFRLYSVCRNWFSKSMWFSILAGELLLDTRDLHYGSPVGFAQNQHFPHHGYLKNNRVWYIQATDWLDLSEPMQSSFLLWVLWIS